MAKYGFIGMGNMGYAMMQSLLKTTDKAEIIFADHNQKRVRQVYSDTGVVFADSNAECAAKAKYLILAVKPQFFDAVAKNIVDIVKPNQVVVSIIAGLTLDTLQSKLGVGIRIVRAMPNTPALIGEGMTGVTYEEGMFTPDEEEDIQNIFRSFGKMQRVEERLMSAVTCASGSSPAYVYMFIEALADSAVKYGMPRDMAYTFVAQTVQGAARMVLETGEHPGKLKDMVCSPAGTTIAGVAALEEAGFRNAVIKATDACYARTEALK